MKTHRNTVSTDIYAEDDILYLDLLSFVKTNDLLLSWDANYNVGLIRKNNIIISFQPGLPIVLINFTQQKFIDPIRQENNTLLASPDFIAFLKAILIDHTISVESNIGTTSKATESTNNSNETTIDSSLLSTSVVPPSPQDRIGEENTILNTIKSTNFSRVVFVVLDPGHGGKDPGGVGRFTYEDKKYTLMEKDIVIDVAIQVKKLLAKQFPNMTIVLTRERDEFVSLEHRTLLANKYLGKLKEGEAMVFVSIHANSTLTSKASGYEVWYLPPDFRRSNLVSETLNHSQIYSIINNLREEEITLESSRLAELVIGGLTEQVGDLSSNRGIKEEKFYVVRNTKMPAVLVELGFVTNAQEGYYLTKDDYRDKLSVGIVKGLSAYLELFNVPQ